MLLYKIGRVLQFAGMCILPAAVMGNVMERIDLRTELTWAGIGIGVFFVGWLLQQVGKPG